MIFEFMVDESVMVCVREEWSKFRVEFKLILLLGKWLWEDDDEVEKDGIGVGEGEKFKKKKCVLGLKGFNLLVVKKLKKKMM